MRVLLVDHDSEALEAITRAIRGVLELDCVTSKGDALLLLRQNTYDVLIACERCVDGSGLDLLGRTTRTSAPLKRIFAAAPERLQLLGPRLAPFKVQRTINYPIELEELWLAIAQVTGTADDTDGTIERVVLDERGIPENNAAARASAASASRGATVTTPPAPTPAPEPAVASLAIANNGRAAARLAQPAPEPPLRPPVRRDPVRAPAAPATTSDTGRMRAPVPPATTSDTGRMRAPVPPASTTDTGRMRALVPPPASTSDTGRMRAPLPPATISDTGRMRALAPAAPPLELSTWEPPTEDDFAAVAAEARLGVQRKTVDEAARRRRHRLIIASVTAVVVAGAITFAIEKFYDPEARARERAIAAEVARMSEAQKATENLAIIEVAIEKAIIDNELDVARRELARLLSLAPEHPRRDFLQASIDRAAELARLAGQSGSANGAGNAERSAARNAQPTRPAERPASTERTAARRDAPARDSRPAERAAVSRNETGSAPRVYGAPLGEPIRPATIPLDAPIMAAPTTAATTTPANSSFSGRTIEASDQPGAPNVPSSAMAAIQQTQQSAAGSAVAAPPPATSAATTPPPAPVDVVPAKLVKRVAPVVDYDVPRRAAGYVIVNVDITDTGRVGNVDVVESTPPGVFDRAALAAVRKWQYQPRKENGVAVASTSRVRIVFEAAD